MVWVTVLAVGSERDQRGVRLHHTASSALASRSAMDDCKLSLLDTTTPPRAGASAATEPAELVDARSKLDFEPPGAADADEMQHLRTLADGLIRQLAERDVEIDTMLSEQGGDRRSGMLSKLQHEVPRTVQLGLSFVLFTLIVMS